MPKAVSLCRSLAAVTVLAMAACGESPTGAGNPAMRPSFDTGFGFGSGNRAQNDSTATTEVVASADATTSTTTTPTTAATGGATTASCSEERGGGWVGPGGRIEDHCGTTSPEPYLPSLSSQGVGMIGGGRSDAGEPTPSTTMATCEERGGWTAGSGNRQEPAPNCADGKAQ